jgi:hypothetical protein
MTLKIFVVFFDARLIVVEPLPPEVNWPDEDIRRISWEVISSTISVFGSLLLFQGFNRPRVALRG